jgi:hypothetical protein
MRRVSDARWGLWRSRWAAIGAAVAVSAGAGGIIHLAAASNEPSTFVAITPGAACSTPAPTSASPAPLVVAISQDLHLTGNHPRHHRIPASWCPTEPPPWS